MFLSTLSLAPFLSLSTTALPPLDCLASSVAVFFLYPILKEKFLALTVPSFLNLIFLYSIIGMCVTPIPFAFLAVRANVLKSISTSVLSFVPVNEVSVLFLYRLKNKRALLSFPALKSPFFVLIPDYTLFSKFLNCTNLSFSFSESEFIWSKTSIYFSIAAFISVLSSSGLSPLTTFLVCSSKNSSN